MNKPVYWKSSIAEVEESISTIKRGLVRTLCKSAGGRDIPLIEYGVKQSLTRSANYNSACGAGNLSYFADKRDKKPIFLLIGAIHGAEMEGTVALLNLVNIIETGKDFAGTEYLFLSEIIKKCRLLIIPIMNVDGRARIPIDTFVGSSYEDHRHYGQGRWKDGSLCGWPECKTVHPLTPDKVSYLGGYYNDNGINLMHDNFFDPMAEETRSLLKLAEDEVPNFTILLHGGSNTKNGLLQPPYVPNYINQQIYELAVRIKIESEFCGLECNVNPLPSSPAYPPPSFNLVCALHHICGGVSAVYESNQGLSIENSYQCTYEEILKHHYILFEQLMRMYTK